MAASLTPAATSGASVLFQASEPKFLEGDVGRQIIYQASRAIIVAFGANDLDTISPNNNVRADIIDDFPSTAAIPAGQWFLRLSPQSDLDPDKKGPVGAKLTLVAAKPSFRVGDNGKFIKIYGGLVRIYSVNTVFSVSAEIFTAMDVTVDDPPTCPAGAWTLEVASWSDINGYPRTAEFYQGRLLQASTTAQPTTWWMSESDNFDSYAVGNAADNAIEYTIASRKINRIEWVADIGPMLMGTSGAEFRVQGQNQGDPLGGDVVPDVKRFSPEGSAPFQPVIVGNKLLFLDRSQKKIFIVSFDLEADGYKSEEMTALAEHITGNGGIRLRSVAYASRPDPRIFLVRRDGQMVVLTYFAQEKVVGFTRFTTDGLFEAVAVVPRGAGFSDRVWVIVARTVGGVTKRYVEYLDDERVWADRDWEGLNSDCAVVYNGAPTLVVPGGEHLEGLTVNVIADGSFRGTRVVSGGEILLEDPASVVEYGLDFRSRFVTMRPAIEGSVIEGLPRSWDKLWLRLIDTVGGTINMRDIRYPAGPPGRPNLYTGDRDVTQAGWDLNGRVTVEQTQPYPMTLLAVFGTLSVGDHD